MTLIPRRARLTFLPLAMSLHTAIVAAQTTPAPVSSSIAARTGGMERRDGFLPIYLDSRQGRILLEVPRDSMRTLLMISQATGLGSNPIGIDRGASAWRSRTLANGTFVPVSRSRCCKSGSCPCTSCMLSADIEAAPEVRAMAELKVADLRARARSRQTAAKSDDERAHWLSIVNDFTRWIAKRELPKFSPSLVAPPGIRLGWARPESTSDATPPRALPGCEVVHPGVRHRHVATHSLRGHRDIARVVDVVLLTVGD